MIYSAYTDGQTPALEFLTSYIHVWEYEFVRYNPDLCRYFIDFVEGYCLCIWWNVNNKLFLIQFPLNWTICNFVALVEIPHIKMKLIILSSPPQGTYSQIFRCIYRSCFPAADTPAETTMPILCSCDFLPLICLRSVRLVLAFRITCARASTRSFATYFTKRVPLEPHPNTICRAPPLAQQVFVRHTRFCAFWQRYAHNPRQMQWPLFTVSW